METTRQKKIAGLLQKDLAGVLQKMLRDRGATGVLLSVTRVRVTTDLTSARVLISIFPVNKSKLILEELKSLSSVIRHEIARLTKHQLRRMPELHFFVDDSLEYIDQIDRELKGNINPVKNPELLSRRKKI